MKLRDKFVLVCNSDFPKRTGSYLLVEIFALAVVYIITARIGQLLAIPPGNVTAVWLPSGIIFVAVLLRGYRIWPGIFLGAFVGNVWSYADLTGFSNILQCLATGTANGIGDVLCAVLGVYLLHKSTGEKDIFLNIKTVTSFILFAAILGPFVSAVLGVTSLCAFGFVPMSKYFYTVATWWTGDSVGVLVISPLLLSFFAGSKGIRKSFIGYIIFSVLFVVASLWCLEEITFGLTYHPPIFFMMPFFIFSALLYGRRLTFSLLLLIVGLSVYVAIVGSNSFLEGEINLVVIDMQLFFGISSIMILCLNRMTTYQKQTEESLMESEQRYRQVVEETDDLITRVDSEGRFTYVNHTAREVFGLEPEECIGLSAFDFIHPEDCEKTQEAFEGWIRSKASNITFENRQVSKTGRVRHLLWSPKIRFDESGNVAGFDSIARDITERKEIEFALGESERRFKNIAESMSDWIWEVDADAIYTYCSANVKSILGYREDEIIGKRPFDFMLADEAKRVDAVFGKYVRDKKPFRDLENWNLTKDGRKVCLLTSGVPILGDNNELLGYRGVDTDITERKRIEEELKLESHMRTVLLDNVPNCFAFILKKGTREIVACNQAAKDVGAFPGKTCYQTYAQRDDPCPFCLAPELWNTNEPKQQEVEYMGRYYEGVWVPLSEELYVHYIFDITERKYSEQMKTLTVKILDKINQSVVWKDSIKEIIYEIKEFTGIEAVGLRLHEGEDFPYYVTKGFSPQFVEAENYLCARDSKGEITRDSNGNPYVECMCGNVICERIDISKDFFTEGGSFWSNNTSKLLAESTDEDRQTRTRNRCNSAGYESVALIPLKAGREVLGLIQLNDKRTNQFTKDMIHAMEGIGVNIGTAFLRMQAEEALKESEERFRSLVDNIPGASYRCLCDEHWTMEFISDEIEKLSGYPATDFIQNSVRSYGSIINPEDRKISDRISTESIARKEPFAVEYRIVAADGSIRWVYEKGQGIFNEQGEIHCIDGVIVDITERKRAEEALHAKTKEMETLLRAVSHDLRTPLVNIDGFSGELANDCEHLTEMLQHVKADAKTKKEIEMLAGKHIPESLSFIRKGTRKMDDLLKGLSYLAKADSVKLDIQQLDINDIAGQVVDTMKFSAREAGAAIELESLPDCAGDEVQVNQVFSNLIGNAIKYLDPERAGRIRIWGKVEGNMVQYCIEDNGVGIPDYHKSKVFEVFHRVDPKSSVSGDGLGLTTTKQIVERHKGRIWLESEEGVGSKFFISLPHHCD